MSCGLAPAGYKPAFGVTGTRRHLLAVGAAALLPIAAGGQASSTADVRATVVSSLALTRTGTTDFGYFENHAHVETISPSSPAPGQSTAQFIASGTPGAFVLVSFDATVTLCAAAVCSLGTMTFTPNVASSPSDNQAGSTANLTSGSAVQLSASGSYFFWLGGSLTVNANQKTGAYSGTFSMSISYQ
jgi:Mat/Ecp fimbriae major subunit